MTQEPKTLDKKTVHRQEQKCCGDIFICFGGTLHKRFQGPVVCCLPPPPNSEMPLAIMSYQTSSYWLLQRSKQRSNQFTILFSLPCGPWKNPVCQPVVINSLAQSSYIMSLVGAALVLPLRDCDDEAVSHSSQSCLYPRGQVHRVRPSPPFHIFLDKCFPAGYPSGRYRYRYPSVMLVQSSKECTPPYPSSRISNLLQPAQAEVVLGQLFAYLASWG